MYLCMKMEKRDLLYGREGIKEIDGGGKFKMYYKKYCECSSVPPVQQ